MKTSCFYLFTTIFLISSFLLVNAQTTVPEGEVTGTWTKANSPYLVEGNILIPNDQTLTIEAGVKVEFQGHYALNVQGRLLAEGSAADSILFTVNDTTGFSNQDDIAGGWFGIRMYDTPTENETTKLSYCRFEFAKAYGDEWYDCTGGALFVKSFDNVLVSNCLFTHCSAGGPDIGVGGAIALEWSDIRISSTSFRNNIADTGGAIHIFQSSVVFSDNVFDNNNAIHGGAIDMKVNSSGVFTNDRFVNNAASSNGGAFIINENSSLQLNNVTISGNTGYNGGAIISENCDITFNECAVDHNVADFIGGALNFFNGLLEINNSEFTFNKATLFGGVMGSYDSVIEIEESVMSDNQCGVLGGAVHSDWSQLAIRNSIFERDSSGETGGGFWLWHCDAYIDECEFNDNRAQYNYAAVGSDSSTVHIDNTTFDRNVTVWGGAIGNQRGALHLTDCIFSDNSADHGGAINGGFTDMNLTNVIFEDNVGVWGGAIDAFNSNLSADYCSFARNEASDIAGAIHYIVDTNDISLDNSLSVRLIGSRFMLNSSGNGMAAILAQQYNTDQVLESVVVDDCLFEDNTSGTNGTFRIIGGIPNVIVKNTIFRNNITHANRSIFGIQIGCTGVVENCLFHNNQPRGAIVHNSSDVAFTNCVFYGNGGAGLDLRRSAVAQVTNSIFWNNGITAALNAGAGEGCRLSFNYCDVEFGMDSINIADSLSVLNWGVGNKSSDPKFLDPINDDFSLFYTSPCLEAGIGIIEVDGKTIKAPTSDIEGNPRPMPVGTNPDMGAYESTVSAGIDRHLATAGPDILYQNYPNPFSHSTTISWCQTSSGNVSLCLMDMQGKHLQTLVDENLPPGENQITLMASDLRPGIYLCRLRMRGFEQTISINIVR